MAKGRRPAEEKEEIASEMAIITQAIEDKLDLKAKEEELEKERERWLTLEDAYLKQITEHQKTIQELEKKVAEKAEEVSAEFQKGIKEKEQIKVARDILTECYEFFNRKPKVKIVSDRFPDTYWMKDEIKKFLKDTL